MRSNRPGSARTVASLVLVLAGARAVGRESDPPPPITVGADAAAAGRDLFTGRVVLHNGGPACASCHSAAQLPFPYGGGMGPDLTNEYSKLGPTGLHYALSTLYFPAMNALFLHRQLTPPEQERLSAFFQSIDRSGRAPSGALPLFVIGVGGLIVFLVLTFVAGRRRVVSVRRALLARVSPADRSRP